jgi:hypothetical protein
MLVLATFAQFLSLYEPPSLVSAFWPFLATQNQPLILLPSKLPMELSAGKHPTQFILIFDLQKKIP